MASRTVNVLLTSFPGLDLPPTLSLPLVATTPIAEVVTQVFNRLPAVNRRFIITTTSNKELLPSSSAPVSSLLSCDHDAFLPLRLSAPLCGGKGGFGSQLRAAGGRMSSKRKKNQGESNSSNRNLDGRRLRTVKEAKALAEYLALKPAMEKKEKEERRKRWEQVVELAERREDEIRNGSKGRVDGKWVEDKEEAGERARGAVLTAMKSGDYHDNLLRRSSSGSSVGGSGQASEEIDNDCVEIPNEKLGATSSAQKLALKSASKLSITPARSYFGFSEDDEFMSDDEEDGDEAEDKGEGEEDEAWDAQEDRGAERGGDVEDRVNHT